MEQSFIRLEIERNLALLSRLNEKYAEAIRKDAVLEVKKEIRLQIKIITNTLEKLGENLPLNNRQES